MTLAVDALLTVAIAAVVAITIASGYRVVFGPTTPDRVVALDTIGTNVVAVALLYAIASGQAFFIDMSLVLAIIGFISTIAVARYVTEGDIIE